MSMTAFLFFENKRTYQVGSIEFDLILNESHTMNSSVTEHPIEDGSNVSDFIQNELVNGSLTGFITNFNLFENGIYSNRAQDVLNRLEILWNKKKTVDISTVLKIYNDVAITSISTNRDENTGETISIAISFKQVKKVKLQEIFLEGTLSINDMKSDKNRQSSPKLQIQKTR